MGKKSALSTEQRFAAGHTLIEQRRAGVTDSATRGCLGADAVPLAG